MKANIRYQDSIKGLAPRKLDGFFVNWPNPPTCSTHLKLLKNSDLVVLAIDRGSKNVVGFITAITDEILCAYIPFLEVLPAYQNKGIGKELVKRMLRRLKNAYMIDLTCDKKLRRFYKKFNMQPSMGMMRRNYANQSGKAF